jgi:spore coat protein U-like protein
MKTQLKLATAVLIAAGLSGSVLAADSADVKVTASVVKNCKISATKDINFGTLDPAAATNASAQGAVVFACTRGAEYKLSADNGQHFDNSASKRRMKGADDNFLPYAIAQDSFSGKGEGFSQPITVALAADIAGADYKDLPADSYADTLRLTIEP